MTVSQTIAFLSAIVAFVNAVPSAVYHDSQSPFQEHIRVPVELGVMSRCLLDDSAARTRVFGSHQHNRCPDALLCESVFDQVVKQVGPQKVDLSLIYVATCVLLGRMKRISYSIYFHYSD